jgi:hypothetical protein
MQHISDILAIHERFGRNRAYFAPQVLVEEIVIVLWLVSGLPTIRRQTVRIGFVLTPLRDAVDTQTSDPRFTVGLEYRAPMSAQAVAVIRPAPSIISLPAFHCILSGKRPLHASRY